MSRLKTVWVPWYRPRRLAMRQPGGGFDFIGWVWRQKASLVNNAHHGWIAFAEDQTPEKLNQETCKKCGQTHKASK